MNPLKWTKRQVNAAQLCADDRLTNEEIAASVGISLAGLKKWRKHPDFQVRIAEIVEAERAAVLARGIAEKQNRVNELVDLYGRLKRTIEGRAADPSLAEIPGGREGMIVARPVMTKIYGEIDATGHFRSLGESELIYEYGVDTGTLKEMRDTMKQAAQELDQWTEKREVTGKGGGPIEVRDVRPDLSKLSIEELTALEHLVAKASDPDRDSGGKGPA